MKRLLLVLFFIALAANASETRRRCDFGGVDRPALTARLDLIGIVSEIGAGQEIARALGHGIVAESRSDYKIGASDATYGSIGENPTLQDYASQKRLLAQLDVDFARVPKVRGKKRFVIADAAETSRGNGHAWLGIKAELAEGAPPVTIVLHVRLRADRTGTQKDDLAHAGVGLLGGVYEGLDLPSVVARLAHGGVEVDYASSVSPFALLERRVAEGVVFDKDGRPSTPRDQLWASKVEPVSVRLTREELAEGANGAKFRDALELARRDGKPLLVLGAHSPTTTEFLARLNYADPKPKAVAVVADRAPTTALEKAERLNRERDYALSIVDLGGRQGTANMLFDARNAGILFRSVSLAEGPALADLERRVEKEIGEISTKRPHKKVVVGNVSWNRGDKVEGVVIVRGQRQPGGEIIELRRPYTFAADGAYEKIAALGIETFYDLAHP